MGRLRSLRFGLLAASIAVIGCPTPPSPHVENAVVICLDTVRFDTLELVHELLDGDEASIQWRRGTSVLRAQTTAPWTLPAIASVFTGLYPNRHQAGAFESDVANLGRAWPAPLSRRIVTLADHLEQRGFETAGLVAHPWFRKLFGLQRGFETLDVGPYEAHELQPRIDAWVARRAARPDARRFFLYLHYLDAHAHAQYGLAEIESLVSELPPRLLGGALAHAPPVCAGDPGSEPCQRYLAYVGQVAKLRAEVARVLDLLADARWLEDTAVVVFSDHGEEFLEHAQAQRARALDPRPLYGVGHGHALYQELLHVPLVFWHPALPAGAVEVAASLVDVAPTLLAWLGVERLHENGPGVDLHPALTGAPVDTSRPLFSSGVAFGPAREAVVRGRAKRIGAGRMGIRPLSFDLSSDPAEHHPRDDAESKTLDSLLSRYRAERGEKERAPRPDPEALEALQALGYLENARE